MSKAAVAALVVLGPLVSTRGLDPVGVAQTLERPDSDTYHWVLPVDHPGVDVAPLHPHDCYVIQQADGIAYFGELPVSATALQRQLPKPIAHRVETREDHPECALDACLRVAQVAQAIQHELTAARNPRWLRRADHRPTPFDDWFGGAYADVGSADRHTFTAAPEQLMLADHLAASRRGHCYEARAPGCCRFMCGTSNSMSTAPVSTADSSTSSTIIRAPVGRWSRGTMTGHLSQREDPHETAPLDTRDLADRDVGAAAAVVTSAICGHRSRRFAPRVPPSRKRLAAST